MMASFTEMRERADLEWSSLVSGSKPWIRVGTAMCGRAAGAFEVVEAVSYTHLTLPTILLV